MTAAPEFDQVVEYYIESGVQQVELSQHALESGYTLDIVRRGFRHAAQLGRAILANGAELAFVFHEYPISMPDTVEVSTLAIWINKSVAVSYVIAPTVTLDTINTNRTIAIALIRMSIASDDDSQPLAPSEKFTQTQIDYLVTWLNDHSILAAEFAGLFDKTPAQMQTFLLNNPRWRLAEIMHDQFA